MNNIALVHDWLVNYMGSERCVESFKNIYPESNVFTIVDFLNDQDRDKILKGGKSRTTFIQKLPFAKKIHRYYFPLFPFAIEQLDVSEHDVILSSSHAFAKGILTSTNQLHICYCHTPIRYAWDLYHQYIREAKLSGITGYIAKKALHKIRMWDYTTPNRVDHFIANSKHIAKRIKKTYNRNADVIYPPVDTELFTLQQKKEDYYLTVSRFVPYKKIDQIVEAFAKMPDKRLLVIGDGPDEKKIKSLAAKNIEIIPFQPFDQLRKFMQNAKAFLFAAEEDFGITIVEAQSCGTPVIAYKVGGASETVIDGMTGILYDLQKPEQIIDAVNKFEKHETTFDLQNISEHAKQFSRYNFELQIENYIKSKFDIFFNQ